MRPTNPPFHHLRIFRDNMKEVYTTSTPYTEAFPYKQLTGRKGSAQPARQHSWRTRQPGYINSQELNSGCTGNTSTQGPRALSPRATVVTNLFGYILKV
jgi:hypothetical protein